MSVHAYTDIGAFQSDVMELLAAHEAENNLPIGILKRGMGSPEDPAWLMLRLEDAAGATVLIALMTPPHNLLLVSPDRTVPMEALQELLHWLRQQEVSLPGVLAERALSLAFADLYAAAHGCSYRIQTQERLYQLDAVSAVPLVGGLRPAGEQDLHYLPYWLKGFTDDCFHTSSPLNVEGFYTHLERHSLFILEHEGRPVSLAGTTRQLPHGRAVGPVYTPPYLRGYGYATSCVAQLSQRILDGGNDFCVLFTDLANPISNSIYQKIGYCPKADFTEIQFEANQGSESMTHV